MFTGIIETMAVVQAIEKHQENLIFMLQTPLAQELKIDQSLAHNGVCLTVTHTNHKDLYQVTAIQETLRKTNLGTWKIGDKINLERAMQVGSRLDGHIVQGHVDEIATCIDLQDEQGSWLFTFEYNPNSPNITIEKGSIAVNGVSLTVVNSQKNRFSVAIIPYTYEHTNFHQIKVGDKVNLEFDMIGKYIQKLAEMYWKRHC
ncbi:MAG: riboflavin synthase [Raineya sp.]|nr:riboflavin synthase [Raineya sp.]MDW8296516.1 riboflavin synthase [Raineya sp.]